MYVDQCNADDPDTEINTGCSLYKEGKYDEALKSFTKAQKLTGYNASTTSLRPLWIDSHGFMSTCLELWYNIALCYYEMKQYAQAVQHLGGIVEKGIKDYPGRVAR